MTSKADREAYSKAHTTHTALNQPNDNTPSRITRAPLALIAATNLMLLASAALAGVLN